MAHFVFSNEIIYMIRTFQLLLKTIIYRFQINHLSFSNQSNEVFKSIKWGFQINQMRISNQSNEDFILKTSWVENERKTKTNHSSRFIDQVEDAPAHFHVAWISRKTLSSSTPSDNLLFWSENYSWLKGFVQVCVYELYSCRCRSGTVYTDKHSLGECLDGRGRNSTRAELITWPVIINSLGICL